MRILLIIGMLVTGKCLGAGSDAKKVSSAQMDSILHAGIDQTLQQEYEAAAKTFAGLVREFPDHPAGFLYQAAVMQTMAMDYEETIDRTPLDSLLDLADERSSRMIEEHPDSPWGYYYRGTSKGYDSYARALRGDWFGAATRGMSSASDLQKTIQLDSLFYDAYAGIGTYYYWKTRKIEFLTWIPFVADRRNEGIRLLSQCVESGEYDRFTALNSLVSIYNDAERYDDAVRCAERALQSYPGNRLFLWALATAQEQRKNLTESLKAYERLLEAMMNDRRENLYNELVCRLKIITIHKQLGDAWEWRGPMKQLMEMKVRAFPEHVKGRAEEKFEEAEELSATMPR